MIQSAIENLDPGKIDKAEVEKHDIIIQAQALAVESAADLEIASVLMQGGNALLKEIDGIFKEPTAKAYDSHRSIKGAWNELRNPVADAIKTIKGKVGGYHQRLEADAERARQLEAKRLRDQEEERRLAAAVAAEERGQAEKAEEIISAPPAPTAAPLITTPPPPKVAGIGTSDKYTGRVVDIRAFVEWVLDTCAFTEYLQLKQGALDRAIQKKKGAVTIPGVEIHKEVQVASRKV